MTLIIGTCGSDFLVTGADTRSINNPNGETIDGVQKIMKLKNDIYFSFSGQKLIPAAILQNYEEGRIPQPKSFGEFIRTFSDLALHIRNNTPYPVAENQFVLYGFDEEKNNFRIVIFHSGNNYQPIEPDKLFFALGNAKYMDWDNDEYHSILNDINDPKDKVERLLSWIQKALDRSYNKEKSLANREPHINKNLKFVTMYDINGTIEKQESLL